MMRFDYDVVVIGGGHAGTEAAAATALSFEESGPPEPELIVQADRPFLYLIRHVSTGAVLFAGQVTDPTASATP